MRCSARGEPDFSDIESTIVPQFLSEIDVERLRNVIVIGASNRQDLIDPAVLRAGRLDVKVKVGAPMRSPPRTFSRNTWERVCPSMKTS